MGGGDKTPQAGGATAWAVAGLLAALAASGGSLYLSLGLGLKACPLCFYQRTFALGALGVLAVGLLTSARRSGVLPALALPLAVGGLGVAIFHVIAEARGKMECPLGVTGFASAPQEGLGALTALTGVLLLGGLRGRAAGAVGLPALVAGLALGAAFAYGCLASVPPPVVPKPEAYEKPPDGCRPPNPNP